MLSSNPSKHGEHPNSLKNEEMDEFSDRSLNYYSDQVPDIKPQLRQLNLEWGLQTALEKIGLPSAMLLGGACGFLFRRKFTLASFFVAGFVLQQALVNRRRQFSRLRRPVARETNDIELERYALKAQLGDYGKLEVIPFK